MKKAFITGIRGFTGQYLEQALIESGYEVYGSVRGHSQKSSNYFAMDLNDIDSVRRVFSEIQPDVVAHLAAISFVGHEPVSEIYDTNIIGTRNLLSVLCEFDKTPDSVLLASTANLYGFQETGVLHENLSPNPPNDYSISKLAMEHMAALWQSKLPLFVVRPFNYTGLGQSDKFLVSKIVSHFKRGDLKIELGNIDVWRDFSDVRTVCDVYTQLLNLSPKFDVFNVCSGVATSLRDILEYMADIAGYSIEVEVNPNFVRANDVKYLKGSSDKLNSIVAAYQRYDFKDTLAWMYRS